MSEYWSTLPENELKIFYTKLSSMCLRQTRNEDEAEDLTHNIVVKLLEKDMGIPDRPYLHTMVKNTWVSTIRARKRRLVYYDENLENHPDQRPTPYGQLAQAELVRKLHRALAFFSIIEQHIILGQNEGKKQKQIADELNIPIGTVKSTGHRARKKLERLVYQ